MEVGQRPLIRRSDTSTNADTYEIRISANNVGYVLYIGCQSFAFETKEKMLFYLLAYLESPYKLQRKYTEIGMRFDMTQEDITFNESKEEYKKACQCGEVPQEGGSERVCAG